MAAELLPKDPVELAALRAEQLTSQAFEAEAAASRTIAELEFGAEQLGFLGLDYFIQANTAFVVPASFSSDEPVPYSHFTEGLLFEGTFTTFSHLRIGQIIGAGSVRAVCMTFESALLFPNFDYVDHSDLLHVPVLAVSSISTAA